MASPSTLLLVTALLLLLSLPATVFSKPTRTQPLLATPLSPDPTTTVDQQQQQLHLAAAGDIANSTTLHFRLAHRDHFPLINATASDLLAALLSRDAARAASLLAATNSTRRPAPRRRRGGFAAPLLSGLPEGSGEYFAQVGVGTPATAALMVLDTGSDVVWLQCAPCRHCYAQSGKVFDPRRSLSYAAVSCSDPLCRRLDAGGCDRSRDKCVYQVAYGDGSVTAGDFATETLTFAHGARVRRVGVGCGHDNEGLFVAAAGLLGLGRGKLSFPSQISPRFGRSFAYCLVDRTSSVKPTTSRSSTVTFGAGAGAVAASTAAFTPMGRNPKMPTFYYVHLLGFSVGGARVSDSELRLDAATGHGGVIIDSGTSVTRLARPVYGAVRDAFRAAAAATGLRASRGGFSLFDTCYNLRGRRVVKVPTLSMHFAGGAEVALPPENYLIPVDTGGTFCFAFAGTDGGVSIIGNIQQQGFRVVFDGDGQRVGFVPKSC
uniref:Peptidase A1 domain-containing protein n=1 Tax=Leersia perrieri TaxID=77586 RepID=A0A0D9WKG9_9ORYZ